MSENMLSRVALFLPMFWQGAEVYVYSKDPAVPAPGTVPERVGVEGWHVELEGSVARCHYRTLNVRVGQAQTIVGWAVRVPGGAPYRLGPLDTPLDAREGDVVQVTPFVEVELLEAHDG